MPLLGCFSAEVGCLHYNFHVKLLNIQVKLSIFYPFDNWYCSIIGTIHYNSKYQLYCVLTICHDHWVKGVPRILSISNLGPQNLFMTHKLSQPNMLNGSSISQKWTEGFPKRSLSWRVKVSFEVVRECCIHETTKS